MNRKKQQVLEAQRPALAKVKDHHKLKLLYANACRNKLLTPKLSYPALVHKYRYKITADTP